jgi:Flp pilus assembly secretin CpaC
MRAFQIAILVILFASGSITENNCALAAAAVGQVPAPAPVPVPAPVVPPAAGTPRPAPPTAQGQKPEEQLRIVADPATNSLIIYGTTQEFQNIKTILRDLDQVPRQVLLDVLVAEVTLKNSESLGVEYEIFSKFNPTIFGQTFGSQGAVRGLGDFFPPAPASGLTQFGNGISGVIGRSNAIRAFINALATDSRVKILSSPSVLATDNRPARIQVGSEEPIPTGQLVAVVGATSPSSSTTIQYRNTGRIVTIIPQVNSQGLVNLQILAEVSQRGANVTVGTDSFPAFDTRQAETSAVVQDGDTLAIGGIIADNRSRSRTGIPYLMDLPVIGRFFGTTSDAVERTELIMLITPHVIRNRDQGQQVTEDFKKSLSTVRNELDRMAREREKLQQRPLEQKPALPGPSGDVPPKPPAPAPAPSAAPSGSGVPTVPLTRINAPSDTSRSNTEARGILPGVGLEMANPAASGDTLPLPAKSPQKSETPQILTAPAYALSMTGRAEKTPAPEIQKPVNPKIESKPARQWAIQVASMDRKQDAEALASTLRTKGYDAYVVTGDVSGKVWHRVRVGPLATYAGAAELQKTLKVSEKFESSYVINQ